MSHQVSIKTLTLDEVQSIHEALTAQFARESDPISPPGERDQALLESAVARQWIGAHGRLKYDDPCANAATLAYGICCNHPFYNGNKRTALVAMLVHLDRNNLTFQGEVRHDEVYRFVLALADHRLHELDVAKSRNKVCTFLKARRKQGDRLLRFSNDDEMAFCTAWISDHVRRIQRGDRPITYREFGRILFQKGYELTDPDQTSSDIIRVEEVTAYRWHFFPVRRRVRKKIFTIKNPGMSRTVPLQVIKDVRRRCGLQELDGVDSFAFYNYEDRIDFFLNEYRNILKRLARR